MRRSALMSYRLKHYNYCIWTPLKLIINYDINYPYATLYCRHIITHLHSCLSSRLKCLQVIEIFPGRIQEPVYLIGSMASLLMTWPWKEPGHQSPCHWPSFSRILSASHDRGWLYLNNLLDGNRDCFTTPCSRAAMHYLILKRSFAKRRLTHWSLDKIVAIPQATFSNAFSWMKLYELRLRFHRVCFLFYIFFQRFELTIF